MWKCNPIRRYSKLFRALCRDQRLDIANAGLRVPDLAITGGAPDHAAVIETLSDSADRG
jgi:hypothetical protein